MIEKAKEAGASGTQTNSDIMGATLRDAHPAALACLPKASGILDNGGSITLM